MSKSSNITRKSASKSMQVIGGNKKRTFVVDDYIDRNDINTIVNAIIQKKEVETEGENGHTTSIKMENNGDITLTPKNKADKDLLGVSRILASEEEYTADENGQIKKADMKSRLFKRILDLDDETSIRKYRI